MFFEGDRIKDMRAMILANNEKERRAALKDLLPHQKKDFIGIFKAMAGLPVTIRLLDPPLHEFLPHEAKSQAETAKEIGISAKDVQARVAQLHEMNPMLGHRGCRLSVTYPEILEMQVTAITEAVIACKEKKIDAQAEIMIPLVGTKNELASLAEKVRQTMADVVEKKKFKGKLGITVGTMIEIPRACLTADEIGAEADFFSFGTNDLTQMTFGYSRDDAEGGFLLKYVDEGILPVNPFQTLDDAVAGLMKIAVDKGRATKPGLELGICGEHGGDPESIAKCEKVGLDYVSCSPFRVPVARLAAAQAALSNAAERDK
jgi:pyruvate,orthophosphate dikinase